VNKNELKMNRILSLVMPVLLVCICSIQNSTAADYKEISSISVGKNIGSTSMWQIAVSQEDTGNSYPQLPAKICFSNTSTTTQQCELAGGVEIITLEVMRFSEKEEPAKGILLMTNSAAMGGGPDYVSLWVYNKASRRFHNILPPKLYVKALGVYKFFSSLDEKSVLIIADPERLIEPDDDPDDPDYKGIWSPHYYIISIYRYLPRQGFVKTGAYKTNKRYYPDGAEYKLIDLEMNRIRKHIK
jgi:hypothetical protein